MMAPTNLESKNDIRYKHAISPKNKITNNPYVETYDPSLSSLLPRINIFIRHCSSSFVLSKKHRKQKPKLFLYIIFLIFLSILFGDTAHGYICLPLYVFDVPIHMGFGQRALPVSSSPAEKRNICSLRCESTFIISFFQLNNF